MVLFVTFDRGSKKLWGIYLILEIHFVTKINNMIVVYETGYMCWKVGQMDCIQISRKSVHDNDDGIG